MKKTKVTPSPEAPKGSLRERQKVLTKCVCCSVQGSSFAMVLCISLFIVLLSVVWIILFFSSVTVLAQTLRGTTLNRVVDRITLALEELTTFADETGTLIEKGYLDFFDDFYATRDGARDFMIMNKKRNELILSVVYHRTVDNHFYSCVFQAQLGNKYAETFRTNFTGSTFTRQILYTDDTFTTVVTNITNSLNPLTLPGTVAAMKPENRYKKLVWSHPHMFVNGAVVASQIVMIRALMDKQIGMYSSMYGLIYTILRPIAFGKYLAEIIGNAQGIAYFVEVNTGFMLATSDLTTPTFNQTATGGYRLLTAYESKNPLIRESALFLNSTQGHFSVMPQKVQDQFTYQGATVFMDTFRFNTSNLDIVFVLLVNQNDLIGNQIVVLIVACLASIFFIAITFATGCAGSQIILRPLRTLRVQMKEAEEMNLDSIDTSYLSYFSEIKSLQHVFYIMVERLVEYRRFLPSHVLQALDEDKKNTLEVSGTVHSFRKRLSNPRASISSDGSSENSMRKTSETKFSIGLNSVELVILSMKVAELQTKVLEIVPPEDYVQIFQSIIDKADSLCRVNRGSLIHFAEDNITLTWPAGRSNSIGRAATVCFALKKHIQELNCKPEIKLSVVFAITTGKCHQGNIGGQTGPRMHKTFGTAVTKAEALTELATAWKTPVLVSAIVANTLEKTYATRPVDVMTFTQHAVGSKYGMSIVPNHNNSEIVYELMGSLAIATDEWMYEITAKQEIEKYSAVSSALMTVFNRALSSQSEKVPFSTERQVIETYAAQYPDQEKMMNNYLIFLDNFAKEGSCSLPYNKSRSAVLYRSLVLDEIVEVL